MQNIDLALFCISFVIPCHHDSILHIFLHIFCIFLYIFRIFNLICCTLYCIFCILYCIFCILHCIFFDIFIFSTFIFCIFHCWQTGQPHLAGAARRPTGWRAPLSPHPRPAAAAAAAPPSPLPHARPPERPAAPAAVVRQQGLALLSTLAPATRPSRPAAAPAAGVQQRLAGRGAQRRPAAVPRPLKWRLHRVRRNTQAQATSPEVTQASPTLQDRQTPAHIPTLPLLPRPRARASLGWQAWRLLCPPPNPVPLTATLQLHVMVPLHGRSAGP
jgi:hypothetical protein